MPSPPAPKVPVRPSTNNAVTPKTNIPDPILTSGNPDPILNSGNAQPTKSTFHSTAKEASLVSSPSKAKIPDPILNSGNAQPTDQKLQSPEKNASPASSPPQANIPDPILNSGIPDPSQISGSVNQPDVHLDSPISPTNVPPNVPTTKPPSGQPSLSNQTFASTTMASTPHQAPTPTASRLYDQVCEFCHGIKLDSSDNDPIDPQDFTHGNKADIDTSVDVITAYNDNIHHSTDPNQPMLSKKLWIKLSPENRPI